MSRSSSLLLSFVFLAAPACTAPTSEAENVAVAQENALGTACTKPTKVVKGTFRDGVWTFEDRAPFTFGMAGDIPIVGDWNGDGRDDVGVFRNINGSGEFSLDMDGNDAWNWSGDRAYYFGYGTDIPIAGDWTGSGKAKIGVFRNSNGAGQFSLDIDGDGAWSWSVDRVLYFGFGSDIPIAGDWTGRGRATIGVFRAGQVALDLDGDGLWNGAIDRVGSFGMGGDRPVIAPWNGDARAQLAVVRSDAYGRPTWSIDGDGDLRWNPPMDSWVTYGGAGIPVAVRR